MNEPCTGWRMLTSVYRNTKQVEGRATEDSRAKMRDIGREGAEYRVLSLIIKDHSGRGMVCGIASSAIFEATYGVFLVHIISSKVEHTHSFVVKHHGSI